MTTRSYGGIVNRNDPNRNVKPPVYIFGARKFKNAETDRRGIYASVLLNAILLEQTTPPDMHQDHLLSEDGSMLAQET